MWSEFIPDVKDIIRRQDPGYVPMEHVPVEGAGKTLYHLCFAALEEMKIQPDPEFVKALLMAGVMGEVPNELPYHGNHHYRKVMLQLVRLIAQHQKSGELSDNEIATLLIAACVHDLGHNGQGNTVNGEFMPGRMELHSFGLAKPYLKDAGLDDTTLARIQVMLLCTDVLPIGKDDNAANLMKKAYLYHFGGWEAPKLNAKLEPLLDDKVLALMALMLHEADLATSAGLSYEITKRETALFRRELTGADDARPSHVVDFLKQVCGGEMLLPASRDLYGKTMQEIYEAAKQDVAAGDVPFNAEPVAEKRASAS